MTSRPDAWHVLSLALAKAYCTADICVSSRAAFTLKVESLLAGGARPSGEWSTRHYIVLEQDVDASDLLPIAAKRHSHTAATRAGRSWAHEPERVLVHGLPVSVTPEPVGQVESRLQTLRVP